MRVANTPRYYVPSPWLPGEESTCQLQQVVWTLGASAWPAANRAIYIPVSFPADCTLYSMYFLAINGSDNYDVGLYTPDYTKVASSGSTAMSAAGLKTFTLPEVRVYGGDQWFAALVLSGTTGQVGRKSTAATTALIIAGAGQEALGSTALPATMTPAAPAAAIWPLFGFHVR